jgi:hypothetical protein
LFKKFKKITSLRSLSFPGTVGGHTDGVSYQDPYSVGSVDPEPILVGNLDPDILCFEVMDVEGLEEAFPKA